MPQNKAMTTETLDTSFFAFLVLAETPKNDLIPQLFFIFHARKLRTTQVLYSLAE